MNPREAGAVFAYPFLWEAEAGKVDSPKDRTTCLIVAKKVTTQKGSMLVHLFLLGITDRPRADQESLEIPDAEKRRAGLKPSRPAHIVVSEYNYDVLPLSWWYDPDSKDYGAFSGKFAADVARRFLVRLASKRSRRTDRTR